MNIFKMRFLSSFSYNALSICSNSLKAFLCSTSNNVSLRNGNDDSTNNQALTSCNMLYVKAVSYTHLTLPTKRIV